MSIRVTPVLIKRTEYFSSYEGQDVELQGKPFEREILEGELDLKTLSDAQLNAATRTAGYYNLKELKPFVEEIAFRAGGNLCSWRRLFERADVKQIRLIRLGGRDDLILEMTLWRVRSDIDHELRNILLSVYPKPLSGAAMGLHCNLSSLEIAQHGSLRVVQHYLSRNLKNWWPSNLYGNVTDVEVLEAIYAAGHPLSLSVQGDCTVPALRWLQGKGVQVGDLLYEAFYMRNLDMIRHLRGDKPFPLSFLKRVLINRLHNLEIWSLIVPDIALYPELHEIASDEACQFSSEPKYICVLFDAGVNMEPRKLFWSVVTLQHAIGKGVDWRVAFASDERSILASTTPAVIDWMKENGWVWSLESLSIVFSTRRFDIVEAMLKYVRPTLEVIETIPKGLYHQYCLEAISRLYPDLL